ncbi:alpha-1,4 glucan phosphorylase L-1 isozyme, chloroplastic/amyloplastic isoform X2 [Diospyros lotus]|uniref:alpha-1,4 glucan phosphorylase L-1 isozyme, chloroplastic/amyloplastic isoform X2 n=1 Tax=Diospyros lotus TaxID=55363 RepID=UPI0022523935|nr:alpha-1,4 glucan phosphorylase L-1 isozyme, chloroplastic/amyloplastic isoform X2 [Diospyros lotus]
MASSPFPVTSTRAEAFSHCNSISRLIDFSSRNWNAKLFLTRESSLGRLRRSFTVRNVSSQPKQKLNDPITEEGAAVDVSSFTPDASSIASSIKYHAEFTPAFSPEQFELPKAFYATAQSVRDALIINWNATYDYYEKMNVKQAYYLSMEFLQGRALLNAIGNLELVDAYGEALSKLGHNLENVACQEPDAALGNGGLGRLASCFLDSLATLNYPAWGYGLRYKYGLFKQRITKDGQEEVAEDWLEMGNPWEIVRNDVSYPVKFYGKVVKGLDGKSQWVGGEDIKVVAYDVPIPGYKTKTTINLRLWSTKAPSEDFDLYAFNAGEHTKACEVQANAEKICYILYPGDESMEGKILRLKQQYTLCSASLQDIIARFERRSGGHVKWEEFPEKVAVQMNDTHPTLCIPELMRILMDLKGMSWREAWNITQQTVAYTNHTVLPEALEKWSLELMQKLLPRHVEIIEMIDEELWPEKFQNKTNGVTTRRWIRFCNPDLSNIITKWTGTEDWVLQTEKLAELRKFADNEDLQIEWRAAKRRNKMKVLSFLKEKTGYSVSPDSMFDVQVKRIHEYKRQLLNILGIVYRYKKMKEMTEEERKTKFVPRVCIFGGKAFATYVQAKRIVKFITDVGATVNHDPEIGDLLKVIFVPDYNVSVAEMLIPASELSQHISTAGMEASGTSNMKFAMNGCLLIGTLDGANVEIREEVGSENFFLFGAEAHEIAGLRKERAEGKFVPDPLFEEVKAFVRSGVFGPYNYEELMGSLEGNKGFGRADYFLVGKDFPSYIECQKNVDKAYQDQQRWTRMSILNSAGSYKFSSDRTIHEYAKDIWNITPVDLP